MAEFLNVEENPALNEQVLQLTLTLRNVGILFQAGAPMDRAQGGFKAELEKATAIVKTFDAYLRDASDLTRAFHTLVLDVVAPIKLQPMPPTVPRDAADRIRSGILALTGALRARVMIPQEEPRRLSVLPTSLSSTELTALDDQPASRPPGLKPPTAQPEPDRVSAETRPTSSSEGDATDATTTTTTTTTTSAHGRSSSGVELRDSMVAKNRAQASVLSESLDSTAIQMLDRGIHHTRDDGTRVSLVGAALPPALDLSNLAALCERLDAIDQEELATKPTPTLPEARSPNNATASAQSASSMPSSNATLPSSTAATTAAATTTTAAPALEKSASVRRAGALDRNVTASSYNATLQASKLDQGFGQYLPAFSDYSKIFSTWVAQLSKKPESAAENLGKAKSALRGLGDQVYNVCRLSHTATFGLEGQASALWELFLKIESALQTNSSKQATEQAVQQFQTYLFIMAACIKETIALNVLFKRRSIFLGWQKTQRAGLLNQDATVVSKVIRIMVVGHLSVGKSSLIRRFCKTSAFADTPTPTQGVEFRVYKVKLDGELIELQILDVTGSRLIRNTFDEFYAVVEGVVIVYDITEAASFGDIHLWMRDLEKYTFLQKVVVANKSDLEEKREVPSWRGQELAGEYNLLHLESSCKTDTNIDAVFVNLVRRVKAMSEPAATPVPATATATATATSPTLAKERKDMDDSDDEGDKHLDLSVSKSQTLTPSRANAKDSRANVVKLDKYRFWTHC